MAERLTRMAVLIVFLVTACAMQAQEQATTETAAATTTTVSTTNDVQQQVALNESDSRQTRERLREVLHSLPPDVGKVLKLDPSLWTNQTYLNTYPSLKAFVAAHPEVAHNSRFYLEEIWIPSDGRPETAATRMWDDMMAAVGVMFGVSVAIFLFTWVIRTVLNYRRWSRLSRVQTEVHTKLLDRFSSNAEVMAYINTTAGRRFLEAAPIPIEEGTRQVVNSPVNRVLLSVQVGLILFAGGIGMRLVGGTATDKEAAATFAAFGLLAMSIAAGFIVAAIVSMILSRRLGLWTPPPTSHTADLNE